MAKVRAQYGARLREADYGALCACRSVGEIAGYLKNHTAYADALEQVHEDLVHRGQLETLLRRRMLDVYMSLSRYSYGDRLFLDLYVRQNEVAQLLQVLRLLSSGSMERYIVSLPVYLAKFMSFDLFALAKIRTFDALLDQLVQTEYYDIIGHFRPYGEGLIDIVGCERALLNHTYGVLEAQVEKHYRGETREQLLRLLYWQTDFHNLSAAWRLKRYFHFGPEKIRENLIVTKSNLSASFRESLIQAADADEMAAILRRHRLLSGILPEAGEDTVHMITRMERTRVRIAQRPFRFSTSPMVVAISYMALLEIEILNLINIIEGVRYGISGEEIYKMLVILH